MAAPAISETVANWIKVMRKTSSSFNTLETEMIWQAIINAQSVESRSPRLKPPPPPVANNAIPETARAMPAMLTRPTRSRQTIFVITGMKSTNRLLRMPAREIVVPWIPKTKLRLVNPRATPTVIPRTKVPESSLLKRLEQTTSMMVVASINLVKTNNCGGIVATPIFVKRKLPPQNKVVRTRNKGAISLFFVVSYFHGILIKLKLGAMERPLCISYIRFSSISQSDGSSLERQVELSRKYAEEHNLSLDDTLSYRDLGKSAYSGDHVKRGHFGLFLELVRQGKIPTGTVLLVESLDRLSRENVLDAFSQFQTIISEGIKIVTLSDGMEYTKENLSSDFGKLIISLTIMARANEESLRKSDRLRAAFKFKRKNLANIKFSANAPKWLKLSDDKTYFDIIPDRVEVVKRIFKDSFEGIGFVSISRQLNKEQIPPPRSSIGWYPSSVRKILTNRAVIGEYQPCTFNRVTRKPDPEGDPIYDYYPRIIDDDLFNAVQNRLTNGTHIAGRTAKIVNLFGGITFCGYCHGRMDAATNKYKSGNVTTLVCDNARRGIKCSYKSIKCKEVEGAFLSYCKEIDIRNVLRNEGEREQTRLSELKKQLSAKNGELQHIEGQITIISNDLLTITDPLLRQHFMTSLTDQLHKRELIGDCIDPINDEINQITSSGTDANAKVNNILELVESFSNSTTDSERIQFRSRLRNEIRQIVKKVVVYPLGKVASDEQIQKVIQKYEEEINSTEEEFKDVIRYARNEDVEYLRSTQKNTKDSRFFTVWFKNGNYRHIKYSKKDNTYKITSERIGDVLDWWMGGKKMKSITLEEELFLDMED